MNNNTSVKQKQYLLCNHHTIDLIRFVDEFPHNEILSPVNCGNCHDIAEGQYQKGIHYWSKCCGYKRHGSVFYQCRHTCQKDR